MISTRDKGRSILILSAGFGGGHTAAAIAVKEALLFHNPGLNIEILDLLEILFPSISPGIYTSYRLMVGKACFVYNYFYRLKQEGKDIFQHRLLIDRLTLILLKTVSKIKPQVIISTFPLCTAYASFLKLHHMPYIKLATCITDIVDGREWVFPGVDLYLVANQSVKDNLISLGVNENLIAAYGIPLRSEFFRTIKPELHLEKYHLQPDARLILIMGGGYGHLPQETAFYHWLDSLPATNSLVVCGSNRRLFNRLKQMKRTGGLRYHAFTHDIAGLMKRADFIVTRAGGVTILESLASSLPMLVYNPVLGQEIQNTAYIEARGLGKVARTPEELQVMILDFLHNSFELELIKERIEAERKELNWAKIPERLLSLMHWQSIYNNQNGGPVSEIESN